MHPAIPHLIELQRVDHQIAALRAELETFPKRIREADAKVSAARAELAAAKEIHTRAPQNARNLNSMCNSGKTVPGSTAIRAAR